jgi:hypothetical protein
MSDESTTPGPGWYPDPSAPGRQRYWDGTSWTEFTDENYAEKTGTSAPGTGVGVSSWPSTPQAAGPGEPAAPAGQQSWVAPATRTNGIAIGSLVTGILALAVCATTLPLGVILGPVAIVLSVKSSRVVKADPSQTGSGLATAGLVTGILGLLIGIALTIFWIVIVNDPLFWEGFNQEFNP